MWGNPVRDYIIPQAPEHCDKDVPTDPLREVPAWQVRKVHRIVSESFGLANGLADPAILCLCISRRNNTYLKAIVDEIRNTLVVTGATDERRRLARIVDSQIWGIGEHGLVSAASIPDIGLKGILESVDAFSNETRKRHEAEPIEKPSQSFSSPPMLPILVVFADTPIIGGMTSLLLGSSRILLKTRETAPDGRLDNHGESMMDTLYALAAGDYGQEPLIPRKYRRKFESLSEGMRSMIAGQALPPDEYAASYEYRNSLVHYASHGLTTYLLEKKAPRRVLVAGPYMPTFHFAQELLATAGRGVLSILSDATYLETQSLGWVRKKLLDDFQCLYLDEMPLSVHRSDHSESDAQGLLWPSALAAIGTLIKLVDGNTEPKVFHQLHESLPAKDGLSSKQIPGNRPHHGEYETATPNKYNHYSFLPTTVAFEYLTWKAIDELGLVGPISGVMEKRGGALIDIDRSRLEERMSRYFDASLGWQEYALPGDELIKKRERYDPEEVRRRVLLEESFDVYRLQRYVMKPFDTRWSYHTMAKFLWNDPRPLLAKHCMNDNEFIVTRPSTTVSREGVPAFFTTLLGDNDMLRGHACYFPAWTLDKSTGKLIANLSDSTKLYLRELGFTDYERSREQAALVWRHFLAIAYAPAYLVENVSGLRQNWPRVPFPHHSPDSPDSKDEARTLLLASAELGRQIAALLDLERPVDGVTQGDLRHELRMMAVLFDNDDGPSSSGRHPETFAITAKWGKLSTDGSVWLDHGQLASRPYSAEECAAIEAGALDREIHAGAAFAALGADTRDIYLNHSVYWRNVPVQVWHYTIGGYQVLKKWLSYRESSILGRELAYGEVEEFTQMVRRLTALCLLGSKLNRNYAVIRDSAIAPEKPSNLLKLSNLTK